eukprot:scaffold2215_cov191-Alexandrium_tamarense.AAC.16
MAIFFGGNRQHQHKPLLPTPFESLHDEVSTSVSTSYTATLARIHHRSIRCQHPSTAASTY